MEAGVKAFWIVLGILLGVLAALFLPDLAMSGWKALRNRLKTAGEAERKPAKGKGKQKPAKP